MKNAARKLLVTTMMLASALSYAEIKAENSTTTPTGTRADGQRDDGRHDGQKRLCQNDERHEKRK